MNREKTYNVNILGTDYKVHIKTYKSEPIFRINNVSGFCNFYTKEICIGLMDTFPGYENDVPAVWDLIEKQTTRHEIVHAFLHESGLASNSHSDEPWAENEEMVDWFAMQGEKIVKAWTDAHCLVSDMGE